MEQGSRKGRWTNRCLERKQRRKEYKQAVTDLLDKRDIVFQKLALFEDKWHYIPDQYKNDEHFMKQYTKYKEYGPWTNQRKLVKKINRKGR